MIRLSFSLIFLILLTLTLGCEQQTAQRESDKDKQDMKGTIVVMGDSLTAGYGVALDQGFPALLENKLNASNHLYRVVNSGVSGETSSGTLSRLSWVLTMKPDIVILETGANDGLRGLPPTLIKKNIRTIIGKLQKNNIIPVLVGMQIVSNMGAEYTEEFKAIYPEIAGEYGVIFMPFLLDGVAAKPEFNGKDGIHPNEKGYRVIAENLFPYVLQAVEEREKTSSLSR